MLHQHTLTRAHREITTGYPGLYRSELNELDQAQIPHKVENGKLIVQYAPERERQPRFPKKVIAFLKVNSQDPEKETIINDRLLEVLIYDNVGVLNARGVGLKDLKQKLISVMEERLKDLNEFKPAFKIHNQAFPITWGYSITDLDIARGVYNYTICGNVKVTSVDDEDQLYRELVSCLQVTDSPVNIDTYLDFARRKLIDDSWVNVEREI